MESSNEDENFKDEDEYDDDDGQYMEKGFIVELLPGRTY